tara:strand:- start:1846 stop:2034 length:189 start_codon:yes stop_codon:yes gene_type:complete
MTEKTEVTPPDITPKELGSVDIIGKIANNQRATAIDAVHDMLFGKASQAMADYKKVGSKYIF